ncbi:NAD(P)-binding protein [Microthyrium microscopicum]|uniref:NAD(P)-binding protein n=1 Tax=Microthyrium microscopicum TaxID=703497 RepID=A0A6A6TWZ2_9PEZI|nr:NAD(P)-binding protein [Microthyrium microscopicum]
MSKGTVLITGSNGYIASHVVGQFLDAGFSVRGTVRSLNSAKGLQEVLKSYVDSGALTFVEVPDITVEGAFDEAVKGVYAIVHMATPVSLQFTDPEPVLKTAVGGVRTILNSAIEKAGPQLKVIVDTSSITTIFEEKEPPYTFTDDHWNGVAEKMVQELGTKTPGPVIYAASKVAAEKEFWAFREQKKPSFAMTTTHPALVLGPALVAPASPEKINETNIHVWAQFAGGPVKPHASPNRETYVDVRDVARIHVWAVEHYQEADGQRYLVVGGRQTGQSIADVLRAEYPDRKDIIQAGNPGEGYNKEYVYDRDGVYFDASKVEKATGQGWIPFDQSIRDSAKAFERYL